MDITGKPADVCPYCGATMFANGTRHPVRVIRRYVWCRNPRCGRKFVSEQPPATLVREITEDDDENDSSRSGRPKLTVVKESA